MHQDMVSELVGFGLSKYESKVYITLLREGILTAKNISNITLMPYGKVYEIIDSLAAKGFAVKLPTKPVKCQAISPEMAAENYEKNVVSQLKQTKTKIVRKLQPLFQSERVYADSNTNFCIINGRFNVSRKIDEIISTAQDRLNILVSENGLKRLVVHKDTLMAAADRGIEIRIGAKVTLANLADKDRLAFCRIKNLENRSSQMFSNGESALIIEPVPDDEDIVKGRDTAIMGRGTCMVQFFDCLFESYYGNQYK